MCSKKAELIIGSIQVPRRGMSSFRDLIQRRACLIVKEIFHDKRRSILNEKYCFYASHIIIIRQEFSEVVKTLPEDIVGKRKWKKLRKKEKKQCVLQDSFCSNFKGCQTPIPFHVNLSEIKSMGIFGFWMIKFVSSEVMKNVSSGYSQAVKTPPQFYIDYACL